MIIVINLIWYNGLYCVKCLYNFRGRLYIYKFKVGWKGLVFYLLNGYDYGDDYEIKICIIFLLI